LLLELNSIGNNLNQAVRDMHSGSGSTNGRNLNNCWRTCFTGSFKANKMYVEITRGRSFKGVAQYCLFDADHAKTSERVDFCETRNLGTAHPHVGWRIMAAKHYQQEDLKRQAGVGQGGRKDGKLVGICSSAGAAKKQTPSSLTNME